MHLGVDLCMICAYKTMRLLTCINNRIKKWACGKWTIIILGIMILLRLSYYTNMGVFWAGDSESYVEYRMFEVRTPLYPLIINFFQVILGKYYLYGVVIFQIITSFLSTLLIQPIAYYTIKALNEGLNDYIVKTVSKVVFILYAVNPSIFVWDMAILTESLSVSSTVLFIYYIVRFLFKKSQVDSIKMVLTAFLATMIRPSSQIIIIDLIVLIIILLFNQSFRKVLYPAIVTMLVVVVTLLGYMCEEFNNNGTFQLTNLKPRHDLVKVLQSGLYLNYPDKTIVGELQELYKESEWMDIVVYKQEVMDLFGTSIKEANINLNDFNHSCIQSDPLKYISYINKLFRAVERTNFVPYANSRDGQFSLMVPMDKRSPQRFQVLFNLFKPLNAFYDRLSILDMYVMVFCLFFCAICSIKNKEKGTYLILVAFGGVSSVVVSTVLATFSEFSRCMLGVIPFYYLGIVVIVISIYGKLVNSC